MDLPKIKILNFPMPNRFKTKVRVHTPIIYRCFFCKNSLCTSSICEIKHQFKASHIDVCQMCFAEEHKIKFDDHEYELFCYKCDMHYAKIMTILTKHNPINLK